MIQRKFTPSEIALLAAAKRVWRQRNNVDAKFFKIDRTCECEWCRARRAFVAACIAMDVFDKEKRAMK